MLRKLSALLLSYLLIVPSVLATHNRAGDITFSYVSGTTYLITITTYVRTSSPADRPELDSVHFGDGTQGVFERQFKVSVAQDISHCQYQEEHTYPGPGVYTIYFEDPNRNADIVNIPNSVNVPFYVESELIINPYTGPDNSPIMTEPPIDYGCVGRLFIYNPGAYDPDGDSLSYELAVCKGDGGIDIAGYTFPANYVTTGGSFSLNPVTGDMIWADPNTEGAFNVAFIVREWRLINGVRIPIGYVKRDMQIYIGTCDNLPPVIDSVPPMCLLAGDTAAFSVCAHDPDGSSMSLTCFGSTTLFNPDSSNFIQTTYGTSTVCGNYQWITSCNRVRTFPYNIIIKATDIYRVNPLNPADTISLVDLQQVSIRVVGPPPLNPKATPSGNSILLTWQPSACIVNVIGYKVYRRSGIYPDSIPCPCDNGVPAYTGYRFLAYVNGVDDTSYVDDNNGNGLIHGVDYCYLITAIYNTEDSTQSCASVQVCSYLKKDLPVITNASVTTTNSTNGAMYVAWSKPVDFDTLKEPRPYEYKVYHSPDSLKADFTLFATLTGLNAINDTTVVDTMINTAGIQYYYKVEFYYDSSGTYKLAGSTQRASSVYLTIYATDFENKLSWTDYVPWTNDSFVVFRQDTDTAAFKYIGTTTLQTYTDSGLINGKTYCYYVESFGYYSAPGYVNPIENLSQRVCSVPVDNIPPCKPPLNVIADCDKDKNDLIWNNPNNSCDPYHDCAGYEIWYYSPLNTDPILIKMINDPADTIYSHINLSANTGCYSIVSVDSSGNKSPLMPFTCVDSCHQYYLPNVFSPDGDGINDFFHPCDSTTFAEMQVKCPPYKNVKDVNMKIFNRWGNLVFQTTDRNIDWDGKNKDSHKDCPDGVYYYICEVHEIHLEGIQSHTITGFVEIIRKH